MWCDSQEIPRKLYPPAVVSMTSRSSLMMYYVLLSSLAFLPALSHYRFIQPGNSGAEAERKKTIKVKLDNISLQLVFVWRRIFTVNFSYSLFRLFFFSTTKRKEIFFNSSELDIYREEHFQLQKAKGILYETSSLAPSISFAVLSFRNYLIFFNCLTRHFWLVYILQFSLKESARWVGLSRRGWQSEFGLHNGISNGNISIPTNDCCWKRLRCKR